MKRHLFVSFLGATFASSLIVAACTDDSSLLQPEPPAASENATAAIPASPLDVGLGTGQCMGNDAVDAGVVSGFANDPLAFNCTANDVRIANARTLSGTPIQCVPGQPINDVDIVADIVETSTSVRHDIGIWVENGDNGVGGAEDGQCDFFHFDAGDIAAEAGVTDGDGDACGDMENASTVNDFDLGDLDLVCPTDPVVVDGRTFIEIASCVSWTQPGGDRVCPIPGEGSPNGARFGTLPANKSKCNCEPFLVEIEVQAQLTLNKVVVNDNGGTAEADDFQAKIDGNNVPWAVAQTLSAGSYTASETVVAGYSAGSWTGDCNADGTITLAPGDVKSCTITNDDISPTLKLVKTVTNDDGGSAEADDFQAKIDGNDVAWDVAQNVDAGAHTASETVVAGYTAGDWGGDCAADGTITLALDEDATCTITNDDQPATLTLVKTVTNDDGGTAEADDFQAKIDGVDVPWNSPQAVDPGTRTASETVVAGYSAGDWGGDCNADGTVSIALGDAKTCTITNDDIAPTLTLQKTVVNDDGGTAVVNDFQAKIDGNNVPWNAAQTVSAGLRTASETVAAGYTAGSWGGDCAADGTITLALDQDATCTITNDDQPATLTLTKTVVNDDGGTAVVNDFQAKIDGNNVPWGVAQSVGAGSFTASETGVAGYAAGSWGGDCAADGSVTLALGDSKTCSITNDDIAPTLTLQKTVINNDGGTAMADDFQARIDGNDVPWNVAQSVSVGMHTASETTLPSYTAGSWGGDCAADGTITLALDQDAVCTITNDDIPQGCEAGDRLTSVSLQLTANVPNPINIGVTDDNGPNPTPLASSPGSITTGTSFTIVPDGGATFFDSQNLRFLLEGEVAKDLKVHLSCSDDPMVGDIHSGSEGGASATLTKTGFTATQFN